MTLKKFFFACVSAASFVVAGCQTTVEPGQSAKQASDGPRPLRHAEILDVFEDKTFSVPTEALQGNKGDAFRQSITYLRDDIDRAYRYYPHWTKGGKGYGKLDYYALGKVKKTKSKDPVVFRGKSFKGVNLVCFQDDLNNNSFACTSVFEAEGRYFFGLAEHDPIKFDEGHHNLLTPLVKRAVADNNNKLLWALAGDFGLNQPELVAKYRRADMNVWAENQKTIRAQNERVEAERKRAAAAKAEKARQERARREAECKRKTGKACPSGGGLIGAMIGGVANAMSNAGSTTSGATYSALPPTEAGSVAPSPEKGVTRDGSGWVKVDGRQIGRVWVSYGYNISCSRGYKPGHGSKSVFGGSFKADVSSIDEAVGVLLVSCKR